MTTYAKLATLAYENKLFLPNIQRGVVWDENDFASLIDSVLRGFPIGAIFIWRTRQREIQFRRFVPSFNRTDYLPQLEGPADQDEVRLVLDGQQRIQGLLIALRGSYDGKQCCVRVAEPAEESTDPDDLRYEIRFLDETELGALRDRESDWHRLHDVYYSPGRVKEELGQPGARATTASMALVDSIRTAFDQEATLIEVGPERSLRQVVSIFVRVNKAGERLQRADLIMALVGTRWGTAGEMFQYLARRLEYNLDATFVLRWALAFLGKSTDLRYITSVAENAPDIQAAFGEISRIAETSMPIVCDAVEGRRGLVGSAGLPLIPLLYAAKQGVQLTTEQNRSRIRYWLFWSHLIGRFSNRGSTKVRLANEAIEESQGGPLPVERMVQKIVDWYAHVQPHVDLRTADGVGEIASRNPSAVLKIFQREHLKGAAGAASYHIDHIFPRAKLERMGFAESLINDVGNLRLYLGDLNERKNAQDPAEHIEGKTPTQLADEFGISDRGLFDYARFAEFVDVRRKRILDDVAAYFHYD